VKKLVLVAGIALFASAVGGLNPNPVEAAGCQAFGEGAASEAQSGALGQLASGAAKSGPGVLKGIIHAEMDTLCD
jgi:hypothetical protein